MRKSVSLHPYWNSLKDENHLKKVYIEKEKWSWRSQADFRLYYKATVIKTV